MKLSTAFIHNFSTPILVTKLIQHSKWHSLGKPLASRTFWHHFTIFRPSSSAQWLVVSNIQVGPTCPSHLFHSPIERRLHHLEIRRYGLWIQADKIYRYNRYLAVAARVVRRSLKEEKRLVAERRGETDLKFAMWEVRLEQFHCNLRK